MNGQTASAAVAGGARAGHGGPIGWTRVALALAICGALAACSGGGGGASGGETPLTLASYDPLTAATLSGRLWMTPQLRRVVSGGELKLSVQADDMQPFAPDGLAYNNLINVAAGSSRVTTLRTDVSVPAASASRDGTANVFGGIRLLYQPQANRGLAFPGANLNFFTAGVELYDTGSGLRIRRRVYHCDDASCVTQGASGITASDPAGFTATSGGNASADAAFDTTYTVGVAYDESSRVFTWTVQGGTFGDAGVSGTADASTWMTSVGMAADTTTNGFNGAQLMARATDTGAGGSSGAGTFQFDNVFVATNNGPAVLWDDFATQSNPTVGLSAARWGQPSQQMNQNVWLAGGRLHLRSACTATGAGGAQQNTGVNPMYPATFRAWQATVAIVSSGSSTDQAQLGGAWFNDGTAGGGPNNAVGDVYANVVLRPGAASFWIARATNGAGNSFLTLYSGAVPTSAGHPLGVGTVHTLFQAWDPASRAFTFRVDDAPPLQVPIPDGTVVAPPYVPARYIQAIANVPPGSPGSSAVEATIGDVRIAP